MPQHEALRLAAQLEDPVNAKLYLAPYIATELRRLHETNQAMLEALKTIANIALMDKGHWAKTIETEALTAIEGPKGDPMPTNPDLIQTARDLYASSDLEIDDNAATAESDDGTWVAAWVWIPKDSADAD